jgi:hypothetical protein
VNLTTAIVALLFSATAVLAQDRLTKEDLATLVVTLGVYDNRCEKLSPLPSLMVGKPAQARAGFTSCSAQAREAAPLICRERWWASGAPSLVWQQAR